VSGPSDRLDRSILEDVDAEQLRFLLHYGLERGYLDDVSKTRHFPEAVSTPPRIAWLRLLRLPVHPTMADEYDLLSRWQNVLSTLHAWGHRLAFVLMRRHGETRIYLGSVSHGGVAVPTTAATQLWQATVSQMPGVQLENTDPETARGDILLPLLDMNSFGAVTGLPSPRKSLGPQFLQTLDQIALGIRDQANDEYDYALVVVADPVADLDIALSMHALRDLGSQLHSQVQSTVALAKSRTDSSGKSVSALAGSLAGTLGTLIPGTALLGAGVVAVAGFGFDRSRSLTTGRTVSTQQLNKVAEYCEQLTDRHVARLQRGRNLGFWSVGTYVLGRTETTVRTLMGMLRSVYSGDESYLEPIRVHLFDPSAGADAWIRGFHHVPLPSGSGRGGAGDTWQHPLGAMYAGVATPLNTEELSITTSLPRRDVPGLRFVRNAVRFASNPPPLTAGTDRITLGRILDTGISLEQTYDLDINTLVRHALLTGVTGSGKSTTCRRLLAEVLDRGLPVLVVEPAKEEYMTWALARNALIDAGQLPGEQRIAVYVAGARDGDGTEIEPLRLNPFEPAQIGPYRDLASRYERFCAILTASLPMADVLPLILQEAVYQHLIEEISPRFLDADVPPRTRYPGLEGIKEQAKKIMEARGYEERVRANLTAAVATRIDALSRGRRGSVLNVARSTAFKDLFGRPAVVNLSRISDDRDKALIMALLLVALFEYRVSAFQVDAEVRQQAKANRLCHLTVVEEAHRLLANPQLDYAGIGNPQAVVSGMFSEALSEIRAYGEGLLIIDQVPARLIPDAIKNTNLKIVHRLIARDDRDTMASSTALREDQRDMIAALQRGEAIVCGDLDDAASWVRIDSAGTEVN
jgi:DNA helicase HerA-like ATPase